MGSFAQGIEIKMETQIQISRMGLEGQGVGYDSEGNIYFVPGSVVGDLVKVRARTDSKKYRDAELIEVLEPAQTRVKPVCQYFQNCGGCDWLHWDYAAQLKAKEEMVRHILERGTLNPSTWLPIQGAEETVHYRNRVQIRRQGSVTGFFRKKTHELVDVTQCKVAASPINEEITKIRQEPLPETGQVTKIELLVDAEGKVHRFENVPHSFSGFQQIHAGQNEVLRKKVASRVRELQARKVLELYCGDGNLTYAYLNDVDKVYAIDASQSAIASARSKRSSESNNHVWFFADQVNGSLLRRLPPEMKDYDTLILDPPRQGTLGCLSRFIHKQLKNIIYVSCAPVTFTQDVQCLKEDFVLLSIEPIDMFPQTRHVELIATWVRRSS